MKKLAVKPFANKVQGAVQLPGSKSITNRVLLLAALGHGRTVFKNVLASQDTSVMIEALRKFGVAIATVEHGLEVCGTKGKFPVKGAVEIFVANSGTSMRFLAAAASCREGVTTFHGKERMHQRPIGDLASCLVQLGGHIDFLENAGFPPIKVVSSGQLAGGQAEISGAISSQFLTAILQVAPLARNPVTISVTGNLVSRPFVRMTLEILRQFKVDFEHENFQRIKIHPQKLKNPETFTIESDATAASYFWGLAAAVGGKIAVGSFPQHSVQGDLEFLQVLERMGCSTFQENEQITCQGPIGKLQPLGQIDLEAIPDAAMTAVVLAALANGKSEIRGLQTLRDKECDRIFALESNLRKMGCQVSSTESAITILGRGPQYLHGAEIETFDDHRLAMCFAVLGAKVPGVTILDPLCVEKTFPDFWEFFARCRT